MEHKKNNGPINHNNGAAKSKIGSEWKSGQNKNCSDKSCDDMKKCDNSSKECEEKSKHCGTDKCKPS